MRSRIGSVWLIAFVCSFFATLAAAGPLPTIEWTRQQGPPQSLATISVSADGLGNVVIAGFAGESLNPNVEGSSHATVTKYDEAGNLLWSANQDSGGGSAASSVSADRLGNIFVTGGTTGTQSNPIGPDDGYVTKYSASGQLQWTNRLPTESGTINSGNSASADGLGNVYVGSNYRVIGNSSQDFGFLSKYDPSGNIVWSKNPLLSDGSVPGCGAVAADGSGHIYLTGTNFALGHELTYLSSYDSNGNVAWTTTFGSSGDFANSVAADRFGNVYVAGSVNDSVTRLLDASLTKFDSAGHLLWTRTFATGHGADNQGKGVSVDLAGNAYLSGYSSQSSYLLRYDSAGNLVWNLGLGNPMTQFDVWFGVAVDGFHDGRVFASGTLGVSPGVFTGFVSAITVPEPSTLSLAVVGLLALIATTWLRPLRQIRLATHRPLRCQGSRNLAAPTAD